MRVVCTGARYWTDEFLIDVVIEGLAALCRSRSDDRLEIIVGDARGADALVARWKITPAIDVRVFGANWQKYGRAAGPIRNRQMLDEKPDLVVAFHDSMDASKGTKDCVKEARRRGIPVWVMGHAA